MRLLFGIPALLSTAALSATLVGCNWSFTRELATEPRVAVDLESTTSELQLNGRGISTRSIPLPVDFSPEGIAVGKGATFYVGSLRNGDIYRGNLRTGRGRIFVSAPAGRAAVGLKVDDRRNLLFVAGGVTGAAYVYDLRSGATVKVVQFAPAGASLLNDVIVTDDAAYFTDSFAPKLYKLSIGRHGRIGPSSIITLTGPAATIVPGSPNLNGIEATHDGRRLIVNHTVLGALFTVNPVTGASRPIRVAGLVPGTLDGLLLDGKSLWVVENLENKVVRVTLSHDLSRGKMTAVIQSPAFRIPTTVAKYGDGLALVNGRFDLGFPPPFGPGPPPGTEFDVVVISRQKRHSHSSVARSD